ncbi:hypothetical protein [Lelliottia amnigena]
MKARSIPYTFNRSGVYYVQVALSDGNLYRKSLLTASYREAQHLMIFVTPLLRSVKANKAKLESLEILIEGLQHPSECDSRLLVIPSN